MKDTQTDSTSLKQRFSSRSVTDSSLFTGGRKTDIDDVEPFHKAPAPAAFHTSEILSRLAPDPLLTVTPEKSLGQALVESRNRLHHDGDGVRKGRPRVRFAPGTRTSPPSKNTDTDSEKESPSAASLGSRFDSCVLGSDEESVPRSFSAVNQKLYQPGRYSDEDQGVSKLSSAGASAPVSGAHVPKRYTVEQQGNSMVYVPLDQSKRNIISNYTDLYSDKPITAKVVRHKPAQVHTAHDEDAHNTELKESFRPSSGSETEPRSSSSSRSCSPFGSQKSSHSPIRQQSPSCDKRGTSPARSSGRLTPEELSLLTVDENLTMPVQVIRETPHEYKLSSYVFPFDGGEDKAREYDSRTESSLARPEFNSALKISAELQSVKERKTDTWGAVSQKLKTCHSKRNHIQEKASSKVNVQRRSGLFSDLVDVDVPLDDLCHNMEKGITLKHPSPREVPVRVPVGREPDMMEFFSPDLQHESPDLTLTGIAPITDGLTTANATLAFDLYRHNRAWNGLTDS